MGLKRKALQDDNTGYAQWLGVILVAAILIVIALAVIPAVSQNEDMQVSEVKFLISTDKDNMTAEDAETLTLQVPGQISLLQRMGSDLDIGAFAIEESMTIDTDIQEGESIYIKAQVGVWWNTQDIESIESVDIIQQANVTNVEYGRLENSVKAGMGSEIPHKLKASSSSAPVSTSESDPFLISPDLSFDTFGYHHSDTAGDLVIQNVGSTRWRNGITVTARDEKGDTHTRNVNLYTDLTITYDEVNAELNVDASVEDIEVPSQGGSTT